MDPISISLEEPDTGETAVGSSYTVKLNSKPTDAVTVTIGGAGPAISLSGDGLNANALTFTTENWGHGTDGHRHPRSKTLMQSMNPSR